MVKRCRPKGLQSLIASLPGPSHKLPQTRRSATTCFLAQPISTHPRASPFDALISMPAQHVLGRTPEGTSRTVLTDQIGLPKVSRPPQRRTFLHHPEASLEHASFRLLYPKTAQKLFSNTADHFCQHLRRHARVPDPGPAHRHSDDPKITFLPISLAFDHLAQGPHGPGHTTPEGFACRFGCSTAPLLPGGIATTVSQPSQSTQRPLGHLTLCRTIRPEGHIEGPGSRNTTHSKHSKVTRSGTFQPFPTNGWFTYLGLSAPQRPRCLMLKLLKAVASSTMIANMNVGSGLCGKQDEIEIICRISVDNRNIITQLPHRLSTATGESSWKQ